MDKIIAQPAELYMISVGYLKEASHEEGVSLLSMELDDEKFNIPIDLQLILDNYGIYLRHLGSYHLPDHMITR